MTLSIGQVTFDCENPKRVAEFWAEAMGLVVDQGGTEFFVSVGITDETVSPAWFFIKVPEARSAKNRLHLDLSSDDRPADIERLVALGATHVADKEEWGHSWSVMADVENNEFCIG